MLRFSGHKPGHALGREKDAKTPKVKSREGARSCHVGAACARCCRKHVPTQRRGAGAAGELVARPHGSAAT
eukprot:289860-Chlamydomonas_euryale.AAC.7